MSAYYCMCIEANETTEIVMAKTRIVRRAGKTFRISGGLWNVRVYVDGYCVAFGIATANDAENWIWETYPESAVAAGEFSS